MTTGVEKNVLALGGGNKIMDEISQIRMQLHNLYISADALRAIK
jgi:hypothetical protein